MAPDRRDYSKNYYATVLKPKQYQPKPLTTPRQMTMDLEQIPEGINPLVDLPCTPIMIRKKRKQIVKPPLPISSQPQYDIYF